MADRVPPTEGSGLSGEALESVLQELEAGLPGNRAISERERKLEELSMGLAHAMPGISWLNAEGLYVEVNQAYASMAGCRPADLVGQHWSKTVLEDDHPIAEDAYGEMLRNGKVEQELRGVRPDGSTFHKVVLMVKGPLRDGKVTGHHCFMRDISERKLAEATLREREEQLRAVLSSLESSTTMLRLDREGRLLSLWGGPMPAAGAGPKEDALGKRLADFVSEPEAEIAMGCITAAFDTGRVQKADQTVEFGDETLTFATTYTPLRDPGGEITAVLNVSHDVTERVRAESHRRALEEEMLRSQHLESLRVLAGGIAHDFNNLLLAIRGNAELAAAETHDPQGVAERLRDIQAASERAADLTKEMLAYAGKGQVAVETVDLGLLVDEMQRLLRSIIPTDIALDTRTEHGSVWVRADATHVRQVVMNLITNAAEASSGSGTIQLESGTCEVDDAYLHECIITADRVGGTYAYVQVDDEGAGMDAATRARMFDPFFTSKFAGRGLGLAGVLGILNAHGGTVHVDSEPGRGTSIRVLLPVSDPSDAALASPQLDTPAPDDLILIVDDDAQVLRVTQRLLERRGYRTLAHGSGREAIAALERDPGEVRAAVVDLTMPDMDGQATFDALRRVRPDLPVLFMSGHSEADIDVVANKPGTGRILKPFNARSLARELAMLLEANTGGGATASPGTAAPSPSERPG